MGWGDHCPNCGLEDCSWVNGKYCEGKSRMTDQKQAPERYNLCDLHLSEGGGGYMEADDAGEYVTYYDYEALAKQRDELEAKLKYHQHEVVDTHAANEADALARAEKAEAERDELAAEFSMARTDADHLRLALHTTVATAEALAKQRDELAAEVERLERDKLRLLYRVKKAEAERDQALAASAAREIAMRDRAADACANPERKPDIKWRADGLPSKNDKCEHDRWMYEDCEDCSLDAIRALPPSPDGQQALDDVRAKAWDEGCSMGAFAAPSDYMDGNLINPHRQPSRSSDAGKSEDRG